MPSMTQKSQTNSSTPRTERSSSDIFDEGDIESFGDSPFDEPIESAFNSLMEIMYSKASAEAELEDLFERRRSHVVGELEKAKKRLALVDRDEKRIKLSLIGEFLGHPMFTNFPEVMSTLNSGVPQDDTEASSLLDLEPSSTHQGHRFLSDIESEEEATDYVKMMRPIQDGITPNEGTLEQDPVIPTVEIKAGQKEEDDAATRRMEEIIRQEEAEVATEKAKEQIAWKEAKTRHIAVEGKKRHQEELKSALKAARKYENLERAGPSKSKSKKGPALLKRAGKRNQIERELHEIDRLLSMINP